MPCQVNMRSYFDRWKVLFTLVEVVSGLEPFPSVFQPKDVEDGSHEKEPTWQEAETWHGAFCFHSLNGFRP